MTLKNLKMHETCTAFGNVYRATVEVCGKEFRLEADLEMNHLQIIDNEGHCETCDIDEDGDVLATGGEYVTDCWTHEDWQVLSAYFKFTPENN